jgi:hypothetical protein
MENHINIKSKNKTGELIPPSFQIYFYKSYSNEEGVVLVKIRWQISEPEQKVKKETPTCIVNWFSTKALMIFSVERPDFQEEMMLEQPGSWRGKGTITSTSHYTQILIQSGSQTSRQKK